MKYFIIMILGVLNLYALVSIAPVEIGDKPGFSGLLKGSFDTKRGNTDSDNYTGGARLAYDNNQSYVMWGEFSFTYAEASGVKNANSTFTHLRYIHTLYSHWDWEAFIQSQGNEFTMINERLLGGGGIRLHLDKGSYGELFFGLGGFYEYIDYSTVVDSRENNLRANFYIAYKKVFTKDSKLSYIGYYQPKVGDGNDYNILNTLELTVLIYKKLSLSFSINYNKDSKPAIGVKEEDFSQHTGFIYKF